MKIQRLPVIVGGMVTIYWLIALCVAFTHAVQSTGDESVVQSSWWDLGFFRVPGYWLGGMVTDGILAFRDHDLSFLTAHNFPWFILIFASVAIGIGGFVWFLMHLIVIKILIRRSHRAAVN